MYISPWSVADCYVYTSISSSAACSQISWQSAHRSYWAVLTVHLFTCLLILDRSLIWSYCLGLKFCVFYMSNWQRLVPRAHMCVCVFVCRFIIFQECRHCAVFWWRDKEFRSLQNIWTDFCGLIKYRIPAGCKKWRGSVRLLAALKGNQLHITAVLRVPSANTMLREVLRIPAMAEGAKVWILVQQRQSVLVALDLVEPTNWETLY